MSDNENAQEAPGKEDLKQSDNKIESSDSPQVEAQATPSDEKVEAPSEETLTLTKKELDDRSKRIKDIAGRRAKREAEEAYQSQLKELQGKQPQQQAAAPMQQPSADHVWDNVLGWIHKDTTREAYSKLVTDAILSMQQQPQSVQVPNVNQQASPTTQSQSNESPIDKEIAKKALDQIDECMVEFEDFERVMNAAGISEKAKSMVLAAASSSPDGVRGLYEMAKQKPQEIYQISRLSPMEQQFKVWDLHKARNEAAKKVSSATPQPEPLETNGSVKKYADLSFVERKKKNLAQQFD